MLAREQHSPPYLPQGKEVSPRLYRVFVVVSSSVTINNNSPGCIMNIDTILAMKLSDSSQHAFGPLVVTSSSS